MVGGIYGCRWFDDRYHHLSTVLLIIGLRFLRISTTIYKVSERNEIMKKVRNREVEFKKAMKEGKSWTTLDCTLTKMQDGSWYFEIDKTVFFTQNGKKDGRTENLCTGEGRKRCETIWNQLVEALKPDEYFVEQY
jgi:hypothetical protein